MRAVYHLGKYPTTYDFASWACYARTMGEDHVHFIIDGPIAHWKYSEDIAWKRWATILLPLCRLAGLTYSVGGVMQGNEYPYLPGKLNSLYKEKGSIEKLKSTRDYGKTGHVTITLRDSFRNRYRNSNREAWGRAEKWLSGKGYQVAVFPECEQSPIDLELRMSIYASAQMNLGIANGPMSLCLFSEAPYISLNQTPEVPPGEVVQYDQKRLLEKQGFPPGSQFAFRNERQKLVYEPDSFENIVRHFEAMQERMAA